MIWPGDRDELIAHTEADLLSKVDPSDPDIAFMKAIAHEFAVAFVDRYLADMEKVPRPRLAVDYSTLTPLRIKAAAERLIASWGYSR